MTERVDMVRLPTGEIRVEAWGGYDGFIRRIFSNPAEALEYVEFLWQH